MRSSDSNLPYVAQSSKATTLTKKQSQHQRRLSGTEEINKKNEKVFVRAKRIVALIRIVSSSSSSLSRRDKLLVDKDRTQKLELIKPKLARLARCSNLWRLGSAKLGSAFFAAFVGVCGSHLSRLFARDGSGTVKIRPSLDKK